MTATMYYDNDADPAALAGQTVAIIGYGSQGHAHALNLHESGVDVVVGPGAGVQEPRAGGRGGPARHGRGRRGQGRRRDHDPRPGHRPEGRLRRGDRAEPAGRPPPDVRPRLQHPLRADRPARHRRRRDGRARRVRATSSARVYQAGGGVPALFAVHRDQSGTARDRVLAYAPGARLHPGGRPRDDLRRGDRDRPVRRAGRPVRRHRGAGQDGASRRSSRPATSPSSPTSRRCTSSSSSST